MEMEWNAKWDWENLVACSNRIESPKNLQLVNWTIVDDGEIHGSFNMSGGGGSGGGGGSSGASGSDGRHGYSDKSSISDSSCKDGMQTPFFKLSTSDGSSGNFSKKIETNGIELSGTSPTPETSVASAEALLGLKLGKRTYFENSNSGGAVKSTSPITTHKKTRSSGQNAPICCQVEGCNGDLSLAKEYHRKHRVCDSHSKFPKVIVGGRERRFCQQCSRFHGLSEFDEKKRSCRRRLSDHNARRRKPHQETIQFNPPRLSAPFYGGTQQMNFVLNNSPLLQSRPLANSAWNPPRFTLTKGCSLKSDGDEVTDEQLRMQNVANGFLASKNSASLVMNPVSKGSVISSSPSIEAAPEYRRALSLLSNNSWNAEAGQFHHQLHENSFGIIHAMVNEIPQCIPFSSSEMWSPGPHPTHHQVQVQSLGTLYDADFYSNVIN